MLLVRVVPAGPLIPTAEDRGAILRLVFLLLWGEVRVSQLVLMVALVVLVAVALLVCG